MALELGGSGQLQHKKEEQWWRQLLSLGAPAQQGLEQNPGLLPWPIPGGCPMASCPSSLHGQCKAELALVAAAQRLLGASPARQ